MSNKAPGKKSIQQAMAWLESIKLADSDSLDGINADVCINTIDGLRHQLNVSGAIICTLKKAYRDICGDKKYRNANSDPRKIIGYVKYSSGIYYTYATYSIEDRVFHGKIEDIDDLVTWDCEFEKDISIVFNETVKEYIELCKDNGKKPNIPKRKKTLLDYLA